jgi:hypothetical protein
MIRFHTIELYLREYELGGKGQEKTARTGGWSGNVLFSREVAPQVSSGLEGLTTVFGMGTGVSLPL